MQIIPLGNKMTSINLAVFDEDQDKKINGRPLYPLEGEDLYFIVPRVGGHLFEKQQQEIIRNRMGIYYNQCDVDRNEIHALWLGEHVSGFGGALDNSTGEDLEFNRSNCRAMFANKGYRDSLVVILINLAANYNTTLTDEGMEAIEELKKR